jgi:hypothetical protein
MRTECHSQAGHIRPCVPDTSCISEQPVKGVCLGDSSISTQLSFGERQEFLVLSPLFNTIFTHFRMKVLTGKLLFIFVHQSEDCIKRSDKNQKKKKKKKKGNAVLIKSDKSITSKCKARFMQCQ